MITWGNLHQKVSLKSEKKPHKKTVIGKYINQKTAGALPAVFLIRTSGYFVPKVEWTVGQEYGIL
jgi:hypothetical protein